MEALSFALMAWNCIVFFASFSLFFLLLFCVILVLSAIRPFSSREARIFDLSHAQCAMKYALYIVICLDLLKFFRLVTGVHKVWREQRSVIWMSKAHSLISQPARWMIRSFLSWKEVKTSDILNLIDLNRLCSYNHPCQYRDPDETLTSSLYAMIMAIHQPFISSVNSHPKYFFSLLLIISNIRSAPSRASVTSSWPSPFKPPASSTSTSGPASTQHPANVPTQSKWA